MPLDNALKSKSSSEYLNRGHGFWNMSSIEFMVVYLVIRASGSKVYLWGHTKNRRRKTSAINSFETPDAGHGNEGHTSHPADNHDLPGDHTKYGHLVQILYASKMSRCICSLTDIALKLDMDLSLDQARKSVYSVVNHKD